MAHTTFYNHPDLSHSNARFFSPYEIYKPYLFSLPITAAHPPRQAAYASWSLLSTLQASAHTGNSFSKTTVPSGKKRGLPSSLSPDTAKVAQPAAHAAYAIGLTRRGAHAARQRGCFACQLSEWRSKIICEGLTVPIPAYGMLVIGHQGEMDSERQGHVRVTYKSRDTVSTGSEKDNS
jgi:hypothetical protein